jgi:lipopolysaccharide/colanic/teichoic acid biosynthesis glycosyltransferase
MELVHVRFGGREFACALRVTLTESIRRGVDIIVASGLLLLIVPVGILIALLVAMDGGPVFYRHRRIGWHGKPFGCLKFRTMLPDAEVCLSEYLRFNPEFLAEWRGERKLARDPRVTGIGNLLRKFSLDEFPQLWNVLVGEMSLVGPRPVTEGELSEKYGAHANLITSVKPGLTGLWQVNGRNDTDYQQRIALDVAYVRSRTLLLDFQILLRTPRQILAATGAR